MAKYSRSSKKNSNRKNRRTNAKVKRHLKKEYQIQKATTSIKPSENYESLILYYITKLKRLFGTPDHPAPGVRENSASKMRREHLQEPSENMLLDIDPSKYTARCSTPRPYSHNNPDDELREKAFNAVKSAIDYGYANSIIAKEGNYFYIKDKKPKLPRRQATPMPNHNFYKKCNCSRCRSKLPRSSSNVSASRNDDRPHTSIDSNNSPLKKRRKASDVHFPFRSKSFTSNISNSVKKRCNCSKCRLLLGEKRKK